MKLAFTPFIASLAIIMLATMSNAHAQRFITDYDSSLFIRDTLRPFLKNMENMSFSGYIQPQFQVARQKGIDSYAGGDFREFSNNRFMIRRARMKIDYRIPGKKGNIPAALFTFQFEATERNLNVRDMFVRIFEPLKANFSLTAGMFARPFGYEVNLSSSYRESPERGRMSQILMPSERDLGAAITYESQQPGRKELQLKLDVGIFNGQGKSGPAEFDSFKDIIGRLVLKPFSAGSNTRISGGLSFLNGGWVQPTQYKYETGIAGNNKRFIVDSSLSNIGDKAPRQYYGADLQVEFTHAWGKTELRTEYWSGIQPGSFETTVNPGELPVYPTYIRSFDGAFFYLIQNLINERWELVAKYDWYDPNTDVSEMEIGKTGTNFSEADIRFATFGFGMNHHLNDNLKILLYYDIVRNEHTAMAGFTKDVRDNVFTWRVQFRF